MIKSIPNKTTMLKIQNYYKLILFSLLLVAACKKGPGDGGNSSIKGYVHATKYNTSFTTVIGNYDASDEYVYIIYGDDASYGQRIKTSPDGKFEFMYLRKGNYTVYVYSKDATVATQHAVSKTLEISKSKETLDAGTFEINRN